MLLRAITIISPILLCLVTQSYALRAYYIGNSLTDVLNYENYKKAVLTIDKTYVWGRHVNLGAPLDWIYTHSTDCFSGDVGGCWANAFSNFTWDVVTLQPFDRLLSGSGEACCSNDSNYVAHFIDKIKVKSPDAQCFIYAQWPRVSNDFDGAWLAPYPGSIRGKQYYEKLTIASQKTPGMTKMIRMIPAGHAMYELNQMAKAGTVPDLKSINEVYVDDQHLNNKGSYIVACVFFGCMYNRNPTALPFTDYNISSGLASAIRQAAWKALLSTPLTGVTGTTISAGMPATHAIRDLPQPASARMYTIQGKCMDKSVSFGRSSFHGLYIRKTTGNGRVTCYFVSR